MSVIKQRKPLFIVVDGIDGVGKTTVVRAICDYLTAEGYDFVETKGLGGTAFGTGVRDLHLSRTGDNVDDTARALLVSAARHDLVTQVIRPAMDAGRIVICDRWVMTTLAYHRHATDLEHIVDIGTQGLRPNFTFLLDTTIDVSWARLQKRAGDLGELNHLDTAAAEEREARRQTMLRWYYSHESSCECISVNATPEVVCGRVLNTLRKLLYMNARDHSGALEGVC